MARDSDGAVNLLWIWRFQLALLPLGVFAWAFKSMKSLAVFFCGGLVSLAWWQAHKWAVARMLTPSKKRRWLFAFMGIFKLVLIAILLHVIINRYPREAVPFATGILLFVAAILLEAARLIFRHFRSTEDDKQLNL
ncbi:MAG: hypothetical protein LBQ86_09080 [Holophagales bacterium]|nr:hypothetical protein [Holophagales bacterium]